MPEYDPPAGDVDPDRPKKFGGDVTRHASAFRLPPSRPQGLGLGDRFSILDHSLDVHGKRLGHHVAWLVEVATGSYAPGEVGKLDAIVAAGILVQQSV